MTLQEKRSAYAPSEEQPVRYDGIYRIARAYRKPGAQGQLVCRYVFIRCDNEPAPWSSEGAAAHSAAGVLPHPCSVPQYVIAWLPPLHSACVKMLGSRCRQWRCAMD